MGCSALRAVRARRLLQLGAEPPDVSILRRLASSTWSVAPLSALLAAALVMVGWLDFASTRREFGALVRAQAASARDTVAAAARANRAAADEARAQLAERLLDNARLLAEIDRLGPVPQPVLQDIASRNHLFRIAIISRDGVREQFVGAEGSARGPGAGWNPGAGVGGAPLLDRLIRGGDPEAITDLHEGRRDGVARLAAGVRRAKGGAILLSVDASDVAALQRQSSLDALLADIVRSTEDIAYIVFEDGTVRRTQGTVPEDAAVAGVPDDPASSERQIEVAGRPILELRAPIDLRGDGSAHLHLGMRLDRLRTAERRTAVRLALSLASAAALGVLAIGLAWVRRRFGALSLEHARTQEALRRRDRLSAMGELASTVAHEIRNPLNAIAMSAQRLKKECLDAAAATPEDAESARELVDVVQREAQRINGKVQQFLEYARPPALHRQPVAVDAWLRGIAANVQPLAASREVELTVETASGGSAPIDPEQLRQAVDNLLLNAIEATPVGGRVALRAATSAGELTIEVRDTGAGITPADLPKIFDLYFTTKRSGTGVGLAVTQQIVSAHGGTIEVESTPARGTTMRIKVPVAAEVIHA